MTDESLGITDPETEKVWEVICELRKAEEHFNGIKAQCRTLASTWLLAAFGAMGFLLTQTLSVKIPTEVIVLAVAFAASAGMLLLWMLDLLVYHRLLDASFTEARKLEEQYPDLPQVRGNMIASQSGGQTPNLLAWYYIGIISAPVLFAGALFSCWCLKFGSLFAILAAAVLALYVILTALLVRNKSANPALPKDSP